MERKSAINKSNSEARYRNESCDNIENYLKKKRKNGRK